MSHLINWRIAAAILAALCLSALSHACTIFVVTYQGTTYFCNNEDWRDPVTRIRFFPAEGSNYGWVSLGFGNDWAQGGVNEHGLCFDWFAHGVSAGWKTDPEKRNHDGNLSEEMLRTCKTGESNTPSVNSPRPPRTAGQTDMTVASLRGMGSDLSA